MSFDVSELYLGQRSRFSYLAKRYGYDWWVLGLFLLPAMGSQIFLDQERLGGNPLLWWLTGLISFSVSAFTFAIAKAMFSRIPNQSAIFVVSSYVFIGFLRGLTAYAVSQELGLAPFSDLGYRLLVGPLFTLVWLSVALVVVGSIREQNLSLRELATERAELRAKVHSANTQIQTLRAELAGRVAGVLTPALEELRAKLSALSETRDTAATLESLRHTVDDVVRPLSHQISTEAIELPKLSGQNQRAGRRGLFPKRVGINLFPLWAASILLATLIGPLTVIHELPLALAIAFLTSILIFGLLSIAQILIGPRKFHPVIAVAIYIGVYAWISFITSIIFEGAALALQRREIMLLVLLISFVGLNVLAAGMSSAYQRYTLDRMQVTNRSINMLEKKLAQQAWMEQRRVALLLHGSVQGALYAAAIRLANMKKPNRKEIEKTLAEIEHALGGIGSGDHESFNLEEALTTYRDLWVDSVEFDLDIEEAAKQGLAKNRAASESVLELVREACNNAIKHGHAVAVSVEIKRFSESLVELRVANRGAKLGAGDQSFGSNLFNQLAFHWTRQNTNDGVELIAQVVV